MAVRTDKCFARNTETFKVYLVTNTVTRVVRSKYRVSLQTLPINLWSSAFSKPFCNVLWSIYATERSVFTLGNTHSFKFKISHCTCCVLCKGLVNSNSDFTAFYHLTFDKVMQTVFFLLMFVP